jgi:hypothetical protein
MSKYLFFNDTGKIISIHPETQESGIIVEKNNKNYENVIYPLELVVFTAPEGKIPIMKLWDYGFEFQVFVWAVEEGFFVSCANTKQR